MYPAPAARPDPPSPGESMVLIAKLDQQSTERGTSRIPEDPSARRRRLSRSARTSEAGPSCRHRGPTVPPLVLALGGFATLAQSARRRDGLPAEAGAARGGPREA